jgi:hypothetical protein
MRALCFSASFASARRSWNSGASPKRIPVVSDSAPVNSRTRGSTVIPDTRGTSAGRYGTKIRMAAEASARPIEPPIVARRTLSVSSCRPSRRRLAPSAARSAISFRRADARLRSRFATLAHAINRTSPTAPSSVPCAIRTFSVTCWMRETTVTPYRGSTADSVERDSRRRRSGRPAPAQQ